MADDPATEPGERPRTAGPGSGGSTASDAERERWHRVAEALNDALDLEGEARRRYLRRLGAEEGSLRRRVEELLAVDGSSEDFLAEPIFSLRGSSVAEDKIGQRVGSYTLVRELGRGGMGTVFLADRTDGEFDQQVAIKILKRGMDTEEIVRRFQAERQMLAGLKHPNIAQLFDGGTTDDGLPYLVMEYVEGEPIDAYCDARRLAVRQRLELVRQVCDAVRLAHQNLIVHRDLKPANILVTREGVPKLLDFGVAKLLDEDAAQALTVARPAPMTPRYASPEQIRGEPITTATDVYALGVLLYELLCGHRPYRVEAPTPQALADAICEQLPLRPSTAAGKRRRYEGEDEGASTPPEIAAARALDQTRLKRQLTGDLDTIVLRALDKDPKRRFPSVEQLSEDLRRYLAGLPITSRADTLIYRSGKFLRRHRWGMAAATAILLLILGFAITASVQLRQIARQAEEIGRERDRLRQVRDFLVGLVEVADPSRSRGQSLTVFEALQQATEDLWRGRPEDPDLRAAVFDAAGSVYRNLDLRPEAREMLEQALKLRLEVFGENHPLVASSLHDLAQLENLERRLEASEQLARRAVAIQRQVYPRGDLELATGLNNLAAVLRVQGRLEEAERLAREGLAMRQDLGAGDEALAGSFNTLAATLYGADRLDEAEDNFRHALEIRRRANPDSPELANTLNSLGTVLLALPDRQAEALPVLHEALEIRRVIYTTPHTRLLRSLHNLAVAHLLLDEPQQAAALIDEAFAVWSGISPPPAEYSLLLRKDRALVLEAMGQYEACETLIREVLADLGDDAARDLKRADAESLLGGCLAGQGRLEEARPLLVESHSFLSGSPGPRTHVHRRAEARMSRALGASP